MLQNNGNGKKQIVCYGELVVDCFGSIPKGFYPKFGGAPGNTAIGLAKLGQQNVKFVGKVAKDFLGDFLADTLKTYKVDVRHLFRDLRLKTTLAFVSLDALGQRSFSFYPGTHDQISVQEVADVDLSKARIFQFGSLTQSNAKCRAATDYLLKQAKQQGAFISYDPNVRPALWENLNVLRSTIKKTLYKVDSVKINEEELKFLADTRSPAQGAKQLWKPNLQLLIITLGAKGAYWKTRTAEGLVQTIPVKVIDTTGAGDAFNAGLLYQLYPVIKNGKLKETDLQTKIKFAVTVGSLSTTRKGAIDGSPTLSEVKRYL